MNIKYWGRGYAGEAFSGFLSLFWSLENRKQMKQLVAKVDPGNVASQRILQRVGRRGEIIKGWYSRPVDKGVKRDIECWYIDRPGVTDSELETWRGVLAGEIARKKEAEMVKEERERVEKEKIERND
jgi:hypothetical protein